MTPERNLVSRLGVLALELDDDLARAAGPLRGSEGVLVARAVRGKPGTGTTTCGPATSSTPSTASRCGASTSCAPRSAGPRPGESLVFHVERSGQLLYVVVELE